MSFVSQIIDQASLLCPNIVLSEGEDDRVIKAALQAQQLGIANIILVGQKSFISEKLRTFALELTPSNSIDFVQDLESRIHEPRTSSLNEEFVNFYYKLREFKGISIQEAQEAVYDPLVYSGLLVRLGYADGSVGGAVSTTSDTVRVAMQIIGVEESKRVSSFFFIICEKEIHPFKGVFIFADCGVIVNPSVSELADIALASSCSYRTFLNEEPRVAMLSFSTKGSARHPTVNKVIRATEMVKQQEPDLLIDGELQFDAAIMPEIAKVKASNSSVAGKANVFVFPNLDSGNIAYKLVERMAGAVAIGPVLQGLKRPANDLSRGCTTEDILCMIGVTVVQSGAKDTRTKSF